MRRCVSSKILSAVLLPRTFLRQCGIGGLRYAYNAYSTGFHRSDCCSPCRPRPGCLPVVPLTGFASAPTRRIWPAVSRTLLKHHGRHTGDATASQSNRAWRLSNPQNPSLAPCGSVWPTRTCHSVSYRTCRRWLKREILKRGNTHRARSCWL